MADIAVGIIYQIDPAGPVTGGIDSVIRGIVKWAPPDLIIKVVGLTEDSIARPVGKWCKADIDGHTIDFFPVAAAPARSVRKGLPLSVLLAWGVLRYRRAILKNCDVLEFHRLEAALPLLGVKNGKTTIVHQNMAALSDKNADMGWRRFPALYFLLERRFLRAMDSVFCVRSDACADYQRRFSDISERFSFLPTWMDTDIFFPPSDADRLTARNEILTAYDFRHDAKVLIAVGRLDNQKNPQLLIDAFALLIERHPDVVLVWVGEGILRSAMEQRILQLHLTKAIVLAGLQSPRQVARLLAAAEIYVMSSAYEGMPISVLEAMACGLPVVSTSVGEVGRVVRNGKSGRLIDEHTPEALSSAMEQILLSPREELSRGAAASIEPFVPSRVLLSVYDAYRRAAELGRIRSLAGD